MAWTLEKIRTKVRRLTGRLSTNQLSNASILEYINDFYQEKMIVELNLQELEAWYDFSTTVNDDDYDLQSTDFTLNDPVYVNGAQARFYTDPKTFYADFPPNYPTAIFEEGDGSTVTFTYTIPKTPIHATTVIVDDQTEKFTDGGSGTLTGSAGGTGTVDYTTGALSVTFNSAPSDGQDIRVTYEYFSTGQPTAILLDSNVLFLRPVPDEVYQVNIRVSSIPAAFSSDSDTPVYGDWGSFIAYGAAIDILRDFDGEGEAQKLISGYASSRAMAGRRFLRQSEEKRALPRF